MADDETNPGSEEPADSSDEGADEVPFPIPTMDEIQESDDTPSIWT